MAKYIVTYNGKAYTIVAENAVQAIDKLRDRLVFGQPMIPAKVTINMIDADTRGSVWAEATAHFDLWDGRVPRKISAELIDK